MMAVVIEVKRWGDAVAVEVSNWVGLSSKYKKGRGEPIYITTIAVHLVEL